MKKTILFVLLGLLTITTYAGQRDTLKITHNLINKEYKVLVYNFIKESLKINQFPTVIIQIVPIDSCRVSHIVYYSLEDYIVGLARSDRNLMLDGGEILGKRIVIAIRTPLAKFIGSDLITYDVLKNLNGKWSESFYEKHARMGDERKTYHKGVYFEGTIEPSMRIVICDDKIESVVYGNDMSYEEYAAKEKQYLKSKEYKNKTRLSTKFKRQDKRALRYRKRLGVN